MSLKEIAARNLSVRIPPRKSHSSVGPTAEFASSKQEENRTKHVPLELLPATAGAVENTLTPQEGNVFSVRHVKPKAQVPYTTWVDFQGQATKVSVSVDEKTARWFDENQFQLDVEMLEAFGPRGRLALGAWTHTLKDEAEFWLLDERVQPLWEHRFLSTEGQLTWDEKTQAPRWVQLQARSTLELFSALGRHSQSLEATAAELTPLPDDEALWLKQPLAEGVVLIAASQQAISSTLPSVEKVLSRFLKERPEQLLQFQQAKTLVQTMWQTLTNPNATQAAQDEVMKAWARSRPTLEPSKAAVCDELKRVLQLLEEKTSNIEVVVIPEGKNWLSLPHARTHRETLSPEELTTQARLEGATLSPHPGRILVCVAENRSDVQEHEFVHLLEALHLTDAQLDAVRETYEKALADGGPFVRIYGMDFEEYLTTWAELFFGLGGLKGVHYLYDQAPVIYQVLRDATGQDPHGSGGI